MNEKIVLAQFPDANDEGQNPLKKLTLNEQIYLLAIWRLKNEAYGVRIRETIMKMTGHKILFGTLYNSLDYMAQKGLLTSRRVKSPSPHGGNRRVYYAITEAGLRALQETRELQESIWKGMPRSFAGGKKQ